MTTGLTRSAQFYGIFQPYLPQLYVESDTDATNCYLFFQRLASKIDIINTFTAQAHNLPDSLTGSVSESLVGICEVGLQTCQPTVQHPTFLASDESTSIWLVHYLPAIRVNLASL